MKLHPISIGPKPPRLESMCRASSAAEPLYVDLRWAKSVDHLSLRHSQFRAAVLDLAAPLYGRPKDELDGEDVRQHRRTRRLAWAASIALILLTITAFAAAGIAVRQANIADQRRQEAERERQNRCVEAIAAQSEVLRTEKADFLPTSPPARHRVAEARFLSGGRTKLAARVAVVVATRFN